MAELVAGMTPDGTEFSSDDRRDGTPWFDALLRFFYVERTPSTGQKGSE
jgi:hypothetical protein